MNNIFENKKVILFIIFFGCVLSILLSVNDLNKYDKNLVKSTDVVYHQMIKSDAFRYLSHGDKIKNQLKEGLNFFETGREHYTKYLPPRVYAAYYYFLDINLFSDRDKKIINIGIHLPYLIFQSILYYLSVVFLFVSISQLINKKACFFIVFFLCFEPTIFQYHSSFWSESIFFSLQIFLLSLILKKKQTLLNFFIISIFLALLSFQKEYSIFYIIPIIIYFYITTNKTNYKRYIIMFVGFFLIQSILGYNNYYRSGKFYLMTADSKVNLHNDLVKKVMQKKLKISGRSFDILEGKASLKWLTENSINYDNKILEKNQEPGFFDYRSAINEKNKIEFDNFIRNRTIYYFKKYPGDFIKFAIKSSIHIVLLNPFHIYSDNNFQSGEVYYKTKIHDKLIPYRIFYSLFIYTLCFYGLASMIKKRQFPLLLLLIISIIYFYSLVSWHGNTRYFMPVVIYLSFFFGFGVEKITNKRIN